LPLKSNHYFENLEGTLNQSVQINFKDDKINIYLTKKQKFAPKRKAGKTLGLDMGLRNLFASSLGDLVGQKFLEKLIDYDQKITKLTKRLQKAKIKPRASSRYQKLISRCRTATKNEVGRCLNRLVSIHQPSKLVLEKLDFRSSKLSKRLNRILSKCGRSQIAKKLESLKEELGIEYELVNPAYTSQTCPKCGYVDKKNRNKESFVCKACQYKGHADVVGAKNIVCRSSVQSEDSEEDDSEENSGMCWATWRSRASILRTLKKQFLNRFERPPPRIQEIMAKNPYFKDVLVATPSSGLTVDGRRSKN
jgi:putative transposase